VQEVENHFDPSEEAEEIEEIIPQIEECSDTSQEIKNRIISLAEHIRQHPE
jgi:uncharacterized coiled-coil DUF342 family protein